MPHLFSKVRFDSEIDIDLFLARKHRASALTSVNQFMADPMWILNSLFLNSNCIRISHDTFNIKSQEIPVIGLDHFTLNLVVKMWQGDDKLSTYFSSTSSKLKGRHKMNFDSNFLKEFNFSMNACIKADYQNPSNLKGWLKYEVIGEVPTILKLVSPNTLQDIVFLLKKAIGKYASYDVASKLQKAFNDYENHVISST